MKILKINDLIQNLAEYPRTTSIQSLKVSFNSFTVMPQLNALFFEKTPQYSLRSLQLQVEWKIDFKF